jgi:hypothetical protein
MKSGARVTVAGDLVRVLVIDKGRGFARIDLKPREARDLAFMLIDTAAVAERDRLIAQNGSRGER